MTTINPNEKIHLITRRHIYALLRLLIPEALFFLAIIIFIIVTLFIKLPAWPEFLTNFFPAIALLELRFLILFLLSLFLQFFWLIIFLTVTDYYFDCWVVTNERTIHTELKALFSMTSSSVSHNKIQDITVDVHGIISTIFRFGNLKIQTAGGFREFIFQEIPKPYKAKDIILQAQKELNEENKSL